MARLHTAARRAFTLLELLVVMSIIGVLLALGASAAHRLMRASTSSATRTTLQRLDVTLRKQLATVNDRARATDRPANVDALAGGDPDRAAVIWLKIRQKRHFPVNFAEVLAPNPNDLSYYTPIPAYMKYLNDLGINTGNTNLRPEAQSAACLYMALRFGPDGLSDEELGVAGAVRPLDFGGGIQIPCLVDSWGRPLTFCRWPTGAATTGQSALYPTGYAAGYSDPTDPKNTLLNATWTGQAAFAALCHPLPATRPAANQPKPMALSMVVVSWGADGKPGVDPLTLQQLSSDSDDNLFSVEAR